jgi:RNA polymerase sigma factor (sigma-70 family)
MDKISPQLNPLSEQEIIHKVVHGETALFEILMRRYNAALYKLARCYGFNHQDAQDLMQEAYLAAYVNLGKFEGRASFKTWVSKILVHKCIYKLSYGAAKHEFPGSDTITENTEPMLMQSENNYTEAQVISREFSRVLEHSLEQMPLIYRTVFILREIEGFNVAETADILNITPINVKVRLNRARAILQKKMEQFYSAADIYEFNLVYCDVVVQHVFKKIDLL